MEDADERIVNLLGVIQESLDRRFSRRNNPDYLEAKNKLEEAKEIISNIK